MAFKRLWEIFLDGLENFRLGHFVFSDGMVKSFMFIFMLIVIPILFSTNKALKYSDMKVGSVATRKVVAPHNFYILKTNEELENERNKARQLVPFYLIYDDSLTLANQTVLKGLPQYLLQNQVDNNDLKRLTDLRSDLLIDFNLSLSELQIKFMNDLLGNESARRLLLTLFRKLEEVNRTGIINKTDDYFTRPLIEYTKDGIDHALKPANRFSYNQLNLIVDNHFSKMLNPAQNELLVNILRQCIEPNLIFDEVRTNTELELAVAAVSLTKDMVYENERIVDANERIDKEMYQKLYSLEVSLVEQSRREGGFLFRFAFIGKMMMVAAILAMFGLYLYSFRKKIFSNNKKILLINLVLLMGIILASLITNALNWSVYLIPTTIVSMLLAILIDSGIAFVGTVVLGLILGTVQGGGLEITLLTVVIGMISIYSVHLIITRNQIFKTIIYIAVAYLWLVVALNSLRFDSIDEFLRIYVYQLLPNAILSPFITFMILGVFERMFDITTDVTLLELSDLNHPLLKRLSMEAPGTFHHSMIVGNLSEAAAKAIGANSLLARVGSYYHDIGKMEKPEYFVENQLDADNRHSRLSPSMSALILASHVRTGIEMARRHGIPKRIRDFIPEHHGTNIMKYFFNKALELSPEKQVNDADFRYPGPKPQSRETGIVMLADAVEAATRTLSAPTPGKIRSFVEDLVDQRLRDGELDECELTFRELKQIIDAFMVMLQGVFQHRIEYPDQERKPVRNNKKEPTGEIRNLSIAKESKNKTPKA